MRTVTIGDLEFKATLFGVNADQNRIVLKCNDQEILRALAESEEPPLIGEDGVAVSPLKRFPGTITFPADPGGKEFIAVYNAIRPEEGDPQVPGMRPVIPYWRGVVAIARVHIETPAGDVITEETDINDVKSPVLDWASLCLEEYDVNFLRAGI